MRHKFPRNKGHILIILQAMFKVSSKRDLKLIFDASSPSVCETDRESHLLKGIICIWLRVLIYVYILQQITRNHATSVDYETVNRIFKYYLGANTTGNTWRTPMFYHVLTSHVLNEHGGDIDAYRADSMMLTFDDIVCRTIAVVGKHGNKCEHFIDGIQLTQVCLSQKVP